jgi:DNA invertase Pin-like site-specific DNA recombinase
MGIGRKTVDPMRNLDVDIQSLDLVADRRELLLERLTVETNLLAEKVREEYAKGEPIKKLARRARVTRSTIYSWLNH